MLIDTAGASLSGGGSIELSDDGHNIITGVAVTATLTNVDDTIEGSGLLGNGQLTLVNDANGVIAATGDANALTVDTEGKVLVNDGTLKATGTAGLVIENTTVDGTGGGVIGKTNTGTVELQNATIVGGSLEGAIDTGSSASTLDGTEQAVTNLGSVTVGDGDQLCAKRYDRQQRLDLARFAGRRHHAGDRYRQCDARQRRPDHVVGRQRQLDHRPRPDRYPR